MNSKQKLNFILDLFQQISRKDLRSVITPEAMEALTATALQSCSTDMLDFCLDKFDSFSEKDSILAMCENKNLTDSQFLVLMTKTIKLRIQGDYYDRYSFLENFHERIQKVKNKNILNKLFSIRKLRPYVICNYLIDDSYVERYLQSLVNGERNDYSDMIAEECLPKFKNKIIDVIINTKSELVSSRFIRSIVYSRKTKIFSLQDIQKIASSPNNAEILRQIWHFPHADDTLLLEGAKLYFNEDYLYNNYCYENFTQLIARCHRSKLCLFIINNISKFRGYDRFNTIQKGLNKIVSIEFDPDFRIILFDALQKNQLLSFVDRKNLLKLNPDQKVVDDYLAAEKLTT